MSIHEHYHWVWYMLGFLFAPRITLAVVFSVYAPIGLVLKIIIWLLALGSSCSSKVKIN